MNKQSSIEWLVSQINVARKLCDDPSMEMSIWHTLDVLIKKGEQAKEMHKQEIEYAFSDGWNDCEKSFKDEQLENDEYCEKHPDEKIMTQRFCNICQSFDYEGWDD